METNEEEEPSSGGTVLAALAADLLRETSCVLAGDLGSDIDAAEAREFVRLVRAELRAAFDPIDRRLAEFVLARRQVEGARRRARAQMAATQRASLAVVQLRNRARKWRVRARRESARQRVREAAADVGASARALFALVGGATDRPSDGDEDRPAGPRSLGDVAALALDIADEDGNGFEFEGVEEEL